MTGRTRNLVRRAPVRAVPATPFLVFVRLPYEMPIGRDPSVERAQTENTLDILAWFPIKDSTKSSSDARQNVLEVSWSMFSFCGRLRFYSLIEDILRKKEMRVGPYSTPRRFLPPIS